MLESRQLQNFDKEKFIEDLNSIYWDEVVNLEDSNVWVQLWTKMFTSILGKYTPLRKRKGETYTHLGRMRDILKKGL